MDKIVALIGLRDSESTVPHSLNACTYTVIDELWIYPSIAQNDTVQFLYQKNKTIQYLTEEEKGKVEQA